MSTQEQQTLNSTDKHPYFGPIAIAVVTYIITLGMEIVINGKSPDELEHVAPFFYSVIIGLLSFFINQSNANKNNLDIQTLTVRNLNDKLKEVAETERLILAASGNAEKQLLVVCADINTPNPKHVSIKKLKNDEKWACTVSILHISAFQDLLLTPDYMDHFLQSTHNSDKQFRIIVTNKKLKHLSALITFLKISSRLGIDTYIFYEENYFETVMQIESKIKNSFKDIKAKEITGDFFRGMGELSISVPLDDLNSSNFSYYMRWSDPKKSTIESISGGNLRDDDAEIHWKGDKDKSEKLVKEIATELKVLTHDDHKVSSAGEVEKVSPQFVKQKMENRAGL